MIKDTGELPDEETHRARSGRVPSTGASVPVKLGCVILPVWMCYPKNWICLLVGVKPRNMAKPKNGRRKELLSAARKERDFPGGPVVRTPCFHCLPRAQVQSLVKELRSHSTAKRKENTRDLSQAVPPRIAKLGKFETKDTRIFVKGLKQWKIQCRIGAKVDRVQAPID